MRFLAKKRLAMALLAALLCLCLLLAGCQGGQTPGGSDPEQTGEPAEDPTTDGADPETQPGDESSSQEQTTQGQEQPVGITYTVCVIGSDGTPRQGAVVCFMKGEEQVVMVATAADGVASAELAPGTYGVVIDNILGEKYSAEGCTLTPDVTSLTVRLYGVPTAGENIYAYSEKAGDHISYLAYKIAEGSYTVWLKEDDMTYYLFTASRGGTFRISVNADLPVSIGYYGSTSFVLTESAADEVDNAITVDVYDDMVYNYAFVIGVKAEDTALTECELTVEYLSERETTEDDLPWMDLMPDRELAQYTKGEGAVHHFDMEGDVVTLVYSEADGYYHVGSADGPAVLINLDNDTAYLDALTTVCSNMRLGVYVYGEDGKLISKDSYNELIWAYHAVSDGGYYPLDDTLLNMLKAVGDYMGWYDASSPMYLFGGKVLTVENAYLFACVYLQ